ncbi:bifunctional phosphoribosyl-AMP cyclohydrolase/phosphoribosyl-ATP diphosphatase HisIE [Homoserinimonas sp. OAct 916]|uniref:bifunctional phosphoribosyl-AMP cyclohydrolase/phosphoribosyl-ATP diphosphatase HisIE n=1 Tax=Homoserinimonas sp. OAct 916 TaxID=2211450 RepID=UPI000DBE41CF|nr:bifunctional phosphoribosyl-AMP cyclohydrolase/phosphoribosyl-ATP diphosphatase HisIE [Homoserinimonas sp. OAct 916]
MLPEQKGPAGPGPNTIDLDALDWAKMDGLVPAIVQDAATGRVLMLGYMNREAARATRDSGRVTFYSRSRQKQWVKGESSGNTLTLVHMEADCDADTLLVQAIPAGPTCHTGRTSCFADAPGNFLGELDALVADRAATPVAGSYTTSLLESGIRRIAQKVGEEGVETALAAVVQEDDDLLGEASDLIYHVLVLLRARGLSLADVVDLLELRHQPTA